MAKQFTSAEQEAFWQASAGASFKAETSADVVLSTVGAHLGYDVLDIGAGTGAFMRRFRRRFGESRRITGVDLAPQAPGILKADCKSLPFPDGAFDTCISTDVIEHLADSDLDACIREIARVLKPGGCGIFTTINEENLEDNMVSCPECRCRFHRWGHCQVFSASRVHELFSAHGFSLSTIGTTNFGLIKKYGLLVRAAYALGIDRWYRTATFNHDLYFVVRRS